MNIFLQTRGKNADYEFLGRSPAERWWLKFRPFTSFERPTLLVTSDAKRWNAYLSGILSSRFDRVRTPIRYSLAIEGAAEEEDVLKAASLIGSCLKSVSRAKSEELQCALDEAFPEADVETLLGDHSPEAIAQIDKRLRNVLARVAGAPRRGPGKVKQADDMPGAWIGSIQAEANQADFLDRVVMLLNGRPGAALMVNLVGNSDEACAIIDEYPTVAVLLVDPSPSFRDEGIVAIQKKNALKQPTGEYPREKNRQLYYIGAAIAIVVLTIGVLAAVSSFEKSRKNDLDAGADHSPASLPPPHRP